jgi:type III secretion protein V
VSEVAARFTLDAMPGKQMAIDAEQRAGAIDPGEARRRRRLLQRESQFYGAMDGAMKFVKGDAIAGIVITVINILGGLAIGVLQRGMPATRALEVYGLLTIGDGLVSQIPALLISTAAGLVVTRVASEESDSHLGADIGAQVFGQPKAIAVASVFLLGLAIVPGLPTFPFLVMGSLAAIVARALYRARRPGAALAETDRERAKREAPIPVMVAVGVDVADDVFPEARAEVVGEEAAGDAFVRMREGIFQELGVPVPPVRLRVRGTDLPPGRYVVRLQEVPMGEGDAAPDRVLAFAALEDVHALGVAAAGSPEGCVVAAADADRLAAAGIRTLDAAGRIARHVADVVRRHAHEMLGIEEVQSLLDGLERAYPTVVRNAVPKPVGLQLLTDVLKRLVEEGVSIRNLREILQTLSIVAPGERDPVMLTEHVRAGLRRQLTFRYARGAAKLDAYLLAPEIEAAVRDSIQRTATGNYLAMDPDVSRDIVGAVKRHVDGGRAVVVTQADVRRYVRRLVELDLPDVAVLSFQELSPEVTVQPIARIGV